MSIDDTHTVARASPLNAKLDEGASEPPHAIGLVNDSAFTGEKGDSKSVMPWFAVAFNPKFKSKAVEDMRECAAEITGFLIVPCQHVSVVNVRKQQWSTRLGDGRGPAIEYKETPCIVG